MRCTGNEKEKIETWIYLTCKEAEIKKKKTFSKTATATDQTSLSSGSGHLATSKVRMLILLR